MNVFFDTGIECLIVWSVGGLLWAEFTQKTEHKWDHFDRSPSVDQGTAIQAIWILHETLGWSCWKNCPRDFQIELNVCAILNKYKSTYFAIFIHKVAQRWVPPSNALIIWFHTLVLTDINYECKMIKLGITAISVFKQLLGTSITKKQLNVFYTLKYDFSVNTIKSGIIMHHWSPNLVSHGIGEVHKSRDI